MNLQNLLNQLTGSLTGADRIQTGQEFNSLASLKSAIPGGAVGGLAAGGMLALLLSNKSARKIAGNAAQYGGAAVLGGLALKAYQNWEQNKSPAQAQPLRVQDIAQEQQPAAIGVQNALPNYHLTMVKAMIGAAKADGHIDAIEQKNIFDTVEKLGLDASEKAFVFDCLNKDITIQELAQSVTSLEQKTQLYLASAMVIEPDQAVERNYLNHLATALALPSGLATHLENQAYQGIAVG